MHFFHFKLEEVLCLPITKFGLLANQAVNMGSFIATGKLEFEDAETKQQILQSQYDELVRRGILRGTTEPEEAKKTA